MIANRTLYAACWIARIGLASAFLSAVADRLGFWGGPGTAGVVWGNVSNYEAYVAQLNWFVPHALVPVVGWTATVAEIVIAIGLLIGWRLRWFSLAAALLLTLFASAMFAALGPKPPLDFSVLSAVGAASLLFAATGRQDRSRQSHASRSGPNRERLD